MDLGQNGYIVDSSAAKSIKKLKLKNYSINSSLSKKELKGRKREVELRLKQIEREYRKKYEKKNKTNNTLHLILSVITVGFWFLVWMYIAIGNSQSRNIREGLERRYEVGRLMNFDKGGVKEDRKELRSRKREIKFKLTELEREYSDMEINHIFHLILSVITLGVWLIFWRSFWAYRRDFDRSAIKKLIYEFNLTLVSIEYALYDLGFCIETEGQTRNGIVYLPNQTDCFTGKNLCVYKNGQKKSEGGHKYGKRDGKWTEWYVNGQLKSEQNYKDGILLDP